MNVGLPVLRSHYCCSGYGRRNLLKFELVLSYVFLSHFPLSSLRVLSFSLLWRFWFSNSAFYHASYSSIALLGVFA